jgi:leader peptidase (prepilin peptidase) / N-methyltransferase
MRTDSANNSPARAGSDAICAAEGWVLGFSGGRSMPPQSTLGGRNGCAGCAKAHVYSTTRMIRILGTIFAGLLGLAFGSFLNVCLSRWPEDESVVKPRSHCRHCNHTLAWWENVPLVSWLALRGRCRGCGAWIGLRYPLVELAVGSLWSTVAWQALSTTLGQDRTSIDLPLVCATAIGMMIFYWGLVALAVLDAENLWLPDWLTLPGIALGFVLVNLQAYQDKSRVSIQMGQILAAFSSALGIVAAAGLILIIRWAYARIRHREGIGLGDVKLMALLAAWLGLPGALLAFGLGVVLGAAVALALLALPAPRANQNGWALRKLPLGTFLCVGGIMSSLWGEQIIVAYLRWAGF